MRFEVKGMTCGHCARAVEQAVAAVDPAASTRVDLASGSVQIDSTAPAGRLADAIRAEGYEVQQAA